MPAPHPPSSPDQGLSLERFIAQLQRIAPRPDRTISASSRLVEDLGFQLASFERLAFLLYERYGIAGLSTACLPAGSRITVEAFFRRYVLDVLGIEPQDD